MKQTFLNLPFMAAVVAMSVISCANPTPPGTRPNLPPDDGAIALTKGTAVYYADYYGIGTASWLINLSTADGTEGIVLNLNMAAEYTFADGNLQEGTYEFENMPTPQGAPSLLAGGLGDGTIYPTYSFIADSEGVVTDACLPTGGTITIEKTDKGYLITTDIEAKDARTDKAVENIKFRYEGTPTLQDQSPKSNPKPVADFEIDDWSHGYAELFSSTASVNNWYSHIFQPGLTNIGGQVSAGSGAQLTLDIYSEPGVNYITPGLYTLNNSGAKNTISIGWTKLWMYEDAIPSSYVDPTGTVNITSRDEENNYVMVLDLTFKNGTTLKGTFNGPITLKTE